MDLTLEEYFEDFRQRVLLGAASDRNYKRAAFLDLVAEKLVEGDFMAGFEHCHYNKDNSGRVDGFYFDEEDAILDLVVADFGNRTTLESIGSEAVSEAFKELKTFYLRCRNGALYERLDESDSAYSLAKGIHDLRDEIRSVNFLLVSERDLSSRNFEREEKDVQGAAAKFDVWDMSEFHELDSLLRRIKPIKVDLLEQFKKGIPCLEAPVGAMAFPTYLGIVPGDILARLYDKYGARLLQDNVRCFLQATTKVNRGIRETLTQEPHMFFSYNNGITATARNVSTRKGPSGQEIVHMTDFQIVNGGQTTASLYHASRLKDSPDLSQVLVQMKLSVVEDDEGEELTSNISKFANTQNTVSQADFESKHPFQLWMEELSRRIWSPESGDNQHKTKWFYERSRGQYRDAQSILDAEGRKKFKGEYPTSQKFTKTDLAKFENVWDEEPRWVHQGAQGNFLRYATRINSEWGRAREQFDESYYQRVIARAIVFKATERVVSSQTWYGGYRANIVAYALSAAREVGQTLGRELDFKRIWIEQAVGTEFLQGVVALAKLVHCLLRAEDSPVQNPSEWAKRADFWTRLKTQIPHARHKLPKGFWEYFVQAKRAAA